MALHRTGQPALLPSPVTLCFPAMISKHKSRELYLAVRLCLRPVIQLWTSILLQEVSGRQNSAREPKAVREEVISFHL